MTENVDAPNFLANFPYASIRDPQKKVLETLAERWNDYNVFVIDAPAGCHAAGTGIIMFDGTVKAVEDVIVGDVLMGPDSTARVVQALHSGTQEMFKISPTKGEPFIVNRGHKLSLVKITERSESSGRKNYGSPYLEISVHDYLNCSKTTKHNHKLWKPDYIEFNNSPISLPIDPYLLGAWLGDGHTRGTGITTMDSEIEDSFIEESLTRGLGIRYERKPNNRAFGVFLTTNTIGGSNQKNSFINDLRTLNVIHNKHIPHCYKTASKTDRLALLAGLIDTDGSKTGNVGYEITQVREMLADDIMFVARSLGFGVTKAIKIIKEKPYYRLHISGDVQDIPVKLGRKICDVRRQKKNVNRTGFSLSSIGDGQYFGFELDKDHLYLTSDFTVHHNTGKSGIAVSIGNTFRSYVLTDSKSLQDQYLNEFPNRLSSIKGKTNYVCLKNDAHTVETSPCQVNKVFVNRCRETTTCLYYKAREEAAASRLFLTNYNYFFQIAKSSSMQRRPVVICDEGHVVSEKLADFAKVEISIPYLIKHFDLDVLEDLRFEASDVEEDIIDKVTAINAALRYQRDILLTNLADFFGVFVDLRDNMSSEEVMVVFDDAIKNASLKLDAVDKQTNEYMKLVKSLNNQISKIEFYLSNLQDDWVLDPSSDGLKIAITPIDARRVFASTLLSKTDKVVLMSASMGSVENLAEELGIPVKTICVIACDSPFDPAKAPIHVMGDFDFSYKGLDISLPDAMVLIDNILETFDDQKGIIHTGNYKISQYILQNSKFKNRLIGKATDEFTSNEMLLEQHVKDSNPTVLISPSMHTGIDLKGDLSGFQIIVKFPFASLQDKRIKMKTKVSGNWYANETWKKIIQASGRSIRTEDDEATTFILDGAFHAQYRMFRKHLPNWFKNRIIIQGDE